MDCTIYGTFKGNWAYLSGEIVTNSQGKSSQSLNGINVMFTYLCYEDSVGTRVINNLWVAICLIHQAEVVLAWPERSYSSPDSTPGQFHDVCNLYGTKL